MNLNQLEYFVSVAENLNFTKAARECFISQTAISQQIRALEETVGVPLLLRDKHHVELTTAGKVYLKEAKEILAHNHEALRLARLASEGIQGEVTIGFIRGYGHSEFGGVLREFHRAYPNIQIHLVRDNMSVLLDMLDHGTCDIVLVISPSRLQYPALNHHILKEYPVMGVLYKDHPLAGRPYLTYSELKDEEFIMMEPAGRPRDQLEESMLIYERGGYLPNIIAVDGESETLMLMIAAGMGISILPEYITLPYMRSEDLRILPMVKADHSTETLDFEVAWSKENTNPAVDHFLEICR